ncbi:MAG: YggU family protein [Nitrospira sp. CR1.3]|nr:YggU family protein [Nitrospira sp. CR1.3]
MKPAIVQGSKDGTVLTVHVQPKSSRTECVGRYGDALKIRVAAPPIDGEANEELTRFLACELAIPRTAVRIESGAGGRHKRVLLKGVRASDVQAYLNRKGW